VYFGWAQVAGGNGFGCLRCLAHPACRLRGSGPERQLPNLAFADTREKTLGDARAHSQQAFAAAHLTLSLTAISTRDMRRGVLGAILNL
jgi:hypothetical protein